MSEIFDLLFLDCETGGLSELEHDIVEIALERLDARTLQSKGSYHQYIYPVRSVTPEAQKVNGYSQAKWDELHAVELRRALIDINNSGILVGATAAGQNPSFDMRFLHESWDRAGPGPFPKMDYHLIDIATLAWPLHIGGIIPGVGLRHTSEFFGLGVQQHNALDDLKKTIQVYRMIMEIYSGERTIAKRIEA